MKFARLITLFTSVTLLLVACNKGPDINVNVNANTNPLLAFAPADTPYVFAALEPAPEEITDAYIARTQPLLDVIEKKLAQFQAEVAAGEHEQAAKLVAAVGDELGGKISVNSLEKLGISIQAHHAVYGMGIFPVIRLELKDAKALRTAITRVETKMGFKLPSKDFNGTAYWRVAQDSVPVGLYIAILDQQLALSVFPVNAESSLLAAFLGQEMPANSMASSNALAKLNSEKGYSDYGSGVLDLQKLAHEIFDPTSTTRTLLGPAISPGLSSFDRVCIAELKAMLAKAPRITAGITALSADEVGMRYQLEMDGTLANALSSVVSDTPVAGTGDQLLNASLALKIGKLRSLLLEKANVLVAAPYQCKQFHDLNQAARQMAQQLNIPMPPMVNNLMGVRVSIDDIDPQATVPVVSGMAAIHVDKPEMIVGMASMMVPGFDNLDLANQTEPVRIPQDTLGLQNMEIFALMGDDAIGLALGDKSAAGLKTFMQAKGQDDDTFFSVNYDLARQLDIQRDMLKKWKVTPGSGDQELKELTKAARVAYAPMAGTTYINMKFTKHGLVVDQRMTFQ